MRSIHIPASTEYDVLIGEGLLDGSGAMAARVVGPRKCLIVTDSTVEGLYADGVQRSFTHAGFEASRCAFPAGEASKNLDTLTDILMAMGGAKLSRSDLVVALGGGVVGDIAGFAAARGDLFDNASMILCPPPEASIEAREAAKAFFLEAGFKMVRFCTPEAHDQMIAYTSQLAHIVSGAYVKNPLAAEHKGFSAGSFLDMTRVARMNEVMWTELFLENGDLLLPALDDLILRLQQYRDALATGSPEKLMPVLREGRECKEALD